MEYMELGTSGPRVSRVGLGTWQAGGGPWGEVREEDCVAAIVRAVELGVNLVDTAEAYGNGRSEEVVGQALKQVDRDEVVVATKVTGSHTRYDHALKACERSRKRLGVDAIDLYQVHWPDPWHQIPLRETMRAMERLHRDGAIRAVGVSNFAVRDLEEARSALSTADIVSNQVQYSLVHREIEKEVLPYCQREGIGVLAWSPLAKGALTGKYGPDRKPDGPLQSGHVLFRDRNLASMAGLLDVLWEVAKTREATPAQVALNWLLAKGVVPIPGAKRPAHVEGNVVAAAWSLTAGEVAALDATSERVAIDPFAD